MIIGLILLFEFSNRAPLRPREIGIPQGQRLSQLTIAIPFDAESTRYRSPFVSDFIDDRVTPQRAQRSTPPVARAESMHLSTSKYCKIILKQWMESGKKLPLQERK